MAGLPDAQLAAAVAAARNACTSAVYLAGYVFQPVVLVNGPSAMAARTAVNSEGVMSNHTARSRPCHEGRGARSSRWAEEARCVLGRQATEQGSCCRRWLLAQPLAQHAGRRERGTHVSASRRSRKVPPQCCWRAHSSAPQTPAAPRAWAAPTLQTCMPQVALGEPAALCDQHASCPAAAPAGSV